MDIQNDTVKLKHYDFYVNTLSHNKSNIYYEAELRGIKPKESKYNTINKIEINLIIIIFLSFLRFSSTFLQRYYFQAPYQLIP
jgi:hypothetical protein